MTSMQIAFPASPAAPARTPAARPAEGARFEDHLDDAAPEIAAPPSRTDRPSPATPEADATTEAAPSDIADAEAPDTAVMVALAFAEIAPPSAVLPAAGEIGPSPAAALDLLGTMLPEAGAPPVPAATIPPALLNAAPMAGAPEPAMPAAGALAGVVANAPAAPATTPPTPGAATPPVAATDETALAALAGVLAEETAGPLSAEIVPEETAPVVAPAEPDKKRRGAPALDPLPETIVKAAPAAEPAPARQAPQPVAAAAMSFVAALEKAKPEPVADGEALGAAAAAVEARAQQAAVLAPGRPAVAPAQASIHVGVELARHAAAGDSRFQIRLDPPELGRVDVRLDLADDGTARAHLTVERRDTLDMLSRDHRALERALREAGFETRDGALSFSLKDGGGNGRAFTENGGGSDTSTTTFIEDEAPQPVRIVEIAYAGSSAGTLDIRI